jgi:two-component system, LytTR family, response regulator
MINAIIIDDAQNSIDASQIKLERHCPDIRVIQTCTKPTESIDAISFYKPDLVFLDVEMPAMNGFALLQQIPVINFEIIFVTAYNHYTLPAIRVNAFDYLEKPVDITLLKEAVERLKKKIQGRHSSSASHDAVLHLLKSMRQSQRPAGLALSSADGIEMVNMNDITWIESVNNYTRFHLTDGKKILVSKTLGEYEERLSKYDFIRIHRSHMINLHYLHKYYREDCLVELKNGIRLEVAVRKKQELMDLLKKMG